MKSEDEVQQLIRIDGPQHRCILHRNNVGALEDKTGRVVRYGVANESKKINETFKSSDLIGITVLKITPEMVGMEIGVYTAVEVKKEKWTHNPKDKREVAQLNFLNWVRKHGGYATFANSVDSFRKMFGK